MFESTSRYSKCEDTSIVTKEGEIIKYKKRRFIPLDREDSITVAEINIHLGERIDLISAKVFGDPEQFWRLCDMNGIMHPLDLVVTDDTIGKDIIKIKNQI
ncbi:MAG: hypothetical protein ACRD6U_04300 [Nitrososphaeraceae archaeon]